MVLAVLLMVVFRKGLPTAGATARGGGADGKAEGAADGTAEGLSDGTVDVEADAAVAGTADGEARCC